MKLKKGFTLREICNMHVLVPESIEQINFNKLISLNGSAKFLWVSLQDQDFTIDEACRLLTDKYDVSEDVAKADATQIIHQWEQAGLIE